MPYVLHRLYRGLRFIGVPRKKRPTGAPSRLGRGPHGVTAASMIQQVVHKRNLVRRSADGARE